MKKNIQELSKNALSCWANSRIFIINDESLGDHINNVTNKFWSIDVWEQYLKLNNYKKFTQVNPDAVVINVGENRMNVYPNFIGCDIVPDITIKKNKKDIHKMTNTVFMPRSNEVSYIDLPIYVFCDGSIKKLSKTNKLANNQNFRRIGWGCAVLDNARSMNNATKKITIAIEKWKSAEVYIEIDTPSSDYAEARGVLNAIKLLKHVNTICSQYNIQTGNAHYEKSLDGVESYTFNKYKCRHDAYRQVVIVCDNVHMLYLIACELQFLGTNGSDLYKLSKKIKNEINLTNITGMWIRGHQSNSKMQHMAPIERLFKNCNDLVDNLATSLTDNIEY